MAMPIRGLVAAILRHAALQRFVAGLCMLALVTVGFEHCVHHFDTSTLPAASQVGIDKSGGGPGSPSKASLMVEHCLGCTIIAVVPSNPCDLAVDCAANIGVAKSDAVRSHDLAVELPPPKSST
jgi:hypothetical protein